MRRKVGLTSKEKYCLYHLVRYPNDNDREVAEKAGLNQSTVTAARRRLAEQGYYRTIAVPRLELMGYEILSIGYGHMRELGANPDPARFEFMRKSFFMLSDPNSRVALNMSRNYTEVVRDNESFIQFFTHHEMLDGEMWNSVIFPYSTSWIPNLFDFSEILRRAFALRVKPPKPDAARPATGSLKLTTKERRVLAGLVENPDMSDSDVAHKVSVSRQAASTMHARFLKEGLLQTRRVPSLSQFGFQIVSFAHQKINVGMPEKERQSLIAEIYAGAPAFFFASTSLEFAILTAHSNFEGYADWMAAYSQSLVKTSYRFPQPRVQIFSVPHTKEVRSYDFVPATKDMLERYV
ncbi:MAG: MarR family transcriptional regulator [Euryarchaeota archaeon]|nr:MarR family transcriptional regulator [Euryarchaeota archaeon]